MQSKVLKGKGWFVNECGVIYLRGTVDGKSIRKSTGKKATKLNIEWIKKHAQNELNKLARAEEEDRKFVRTNIEDFGMQVIELTSHKRDEAGNKDYRQKLRDYIVPFFKKYNLDDIKAIHIEMWQQEMLKKKSTATVKRCRNLLNIIMTKAEGSDIIAKNPLKFADNIKVEHEKRTPYTELEMRTIIDNAEGWFKVFVLLAFSTGMRTGEVMALKWDDINLEERYIRLERSITKGKIKDKSNTIGKTKPHERTIELMADMIVMLKEYYKIKRNDKWLFVSKYDEPFKESKTIVKYYLMPLLVKNSIEYKGLYTTRHTFITMMINKGFDKTWVQEMVGHKVNSDVTDNHYFTYLRDNERLESVNNFMFRELKASNE